MLDSAMGQMRVKAAFAAIHAIEGHHPLPQDGAFVERGLGPTASIKQRVDLFHDRTQLLQLGHPPGDPP